MDGSDSGSEVRRTVDEVVEGGVTLTIRLIRSFEFRNWKPVVIRKVNLNWTLEELTEAVDKAVKSSSLPPPFKNFAYDCFKIEYQAFGLKTNDPLINTEEEEKLTLKPGLTLASQGVKSETEISYFRKSDYEEYKKKKKSVNPENKTEF